MPFLSCLVESEEVHQEIALAQTMSNLIEQENVVREMTAGRVLPFPV